MSCSDAGSDAGASRAVRRTAAALREHEGAHDVGARSRQHECPRSARRSARERSSDVWLDGSCRADQSSVRAAAIDSSRARSGAALPVGTPNASSSHASATARRCRSRCSPRHSRRHAPASAADARIAVKPIPAQMPKIVAAAIRTPVRALRTASATAWATASSSRARGCIRAQIDSADTTAVNAIVAAPTSAKNAPPRAMNHMPAAKPASAVSTRGGTDQHPHAHRAHVQQLLGDGLGRAAASSSTAVAARPTRSRS